MWSIQEGSTRFEFSCSVDGDGDYLASLEVAVDGFAGHGGGHIVGREWQSFVEALRQLEKARRGEAFVASAAGGEFELKAHSLDSRGHMGLSGSLRVGGPEWPHQQLRFAFEFDPTKLPELVRSAEATMKERPNQSPEPNAASGRGSS